MLLRCVAMPFDVVDDEDDDEDEEEDDDDDNFVSQMQEACSPFSPLLTPCCCYVDPVLFSSSSCVDTVQMMLFQTIYIQKE